MQKTELLLVIKRTKHDFEALAQKVQIYCLKALLTAGIRADLPNSLVSEVVFFNFLAALAASRSNDKWVTKNAEPSS